MWRPDAHAQDESGNSTAALQGFGYIKPDGELYGAVFVNVGAAQAGAAFASDRPYSHIEMPSDWDRAFEQGFRVVPVVLTARRTPAENEKANAICNWLRRQASAENDPAKREAFIEAHNAALKIKNGEQ